jgi:hypothetical protein
MEPVDELLGPRPVRGVHHLDQGAQVARSTEPLEQVERVRDQDPARRRRRVREHVAPAVVSVGRLTLDDLVRRQVLARQKTPVLEHVLARGGGHVARVQRRGPLRAEPLEQVRELREADALPLPQEAALRRVDRLPLRPRDEDRPEDPDEVRAYPSELVARARDGGRRADEVGERGGAESL